MSERNKDFVIKAVTIFAGIGALFALFVYVSALFEGKVTFPKELESAITLLLVSAVTSASVWLHSRNSARTRQAVDDAKEEIKHTIANGGGEAIAKKAADETAEKLAPLILGVEQRNPDVDNDTGERRRGMDRRKAAPLVSDADNLDARR